MKSNWNYSTTIWSGEDRLADLPEACLVAKIKNPLFVADKDMKNITVEGAQLALEIGPKILHDLNPKHFPLMFSMLNTICENKKLEIDW